jgi:pimeloyl-ACP methyl ester carboxylesterase
VAEVTANGVRLHVQRLTPPGGAAPGAPIVVTVHGMVMDNLSSFYFAIGNALAAAGADVITYDLRGHGKSERTPGGYRVTDAMDDLTALLEALGVDRPVHLVGNSYGATMVLAYGLAHPARVASMTLVEPPFQIDGLGEEMARSLAQVSFGLSDEEVQTWLEEGAGRAVSRITRSAQRLLETTSIAQDMLETEPFRPEKLRELQTPVLAVYGANSDIIHQAQELESLVPACTLVVLEHHTHMVLREAGEYLRELLRWWLFEPEAPRPVYAMSESRKQFVTPAWVTQMVPPPDLNSGPRVTAGVDSELGSRTPG